MKLSVVTTLYNSEKYIFEFHQRILGQVESLMISKGEFEVVYVDDGSPDSSLDLAIELSKRHDHVRVVELSKNHGHHRAMMIGLQQCKGERVFLIDSDLEEAPENLGAFWREMDSQNEFDVVYGIQQDKNGSFVKKSLAWPFIKSLIFCHM